MARRAFAVADFSSTSTSVSTLMSISSLLSPLCSLLSLQLTLRLTRSAGFRRDVSRLMKVPVPTHLADRPSPFCSVGHGFYSMSKRAAAEEHFEMEHAKKKRGNSKSDRALTGWSRVEVSACVELAVPRGRQLIFISPPFLSPPPTPTRGDSARLSQPR